MDALPLRKLDLLEEVYDSVLSKRGGLCALQHFYYGAHHLIKVEGAHHRVTVSEFRRACWRTGGGALSWVP